MKLTFNFNTLSELHLLRDRIELSSYKTCAIFVKSNGWSGKKWVEYFEKNGRILEAKLKSILLSSYFEPTKGIKTRVIVIASKKLSIEGSTVSHVNKTAQECGLTSLTAEVACLLSKDLTEKMVSRLKKFGISWIVVMHEPIKSFTTEKCLLLYVQFGCEKLYWLDATTIKPEGLWASGGGIAFAIPD